MINSGLLLRASQPASQSYILHGAVHSCPLSFSCSSSSCALGSLRFQACSNALRSRRVKRQLVSTAYDDSFLINCRYSLVLLRNIHASECPLSLAASRASSNSIDRCGSSLCPPTAPSSASQIHDCLGEIRQSF